jgi:UDP-N-acetylglucosamine:LPS N-acetylglucosamine transferase
LHEELPYIPKKKKICLVCSHGGHLTEILQLSKAFEGHEKFFISYDTVRTRDLDNKYLLQNIGRNPIRFLAIIPGIFHILRKEKPDIILSTGAEIAIPVFIIAKIFRIRTIFIESLCRIKQPSHTGQIVYPFADIFLVQWESLLAKYGKKARFRGSVF